MDSQLSPEVYRQLLDVVARDEDVFAAPDRQHQQLLSFIDWDVLDDAGAARLVDQYALPLPTAATRKRRLSKPAVQHSAMLPPLPSAALSPLRMPDCLQLLSASSSNANAHDVDQHSTSGASRQTLSPQRQQATSPSKLRKPPSSDKSVLPPLDIRVLQRKRVFLNAAGAPTIGVEEIVQLHERLSPPKARCSPLQLAAIPKKCTPGDEVALMPCHSLQYRYVPSLSGERWREPIRDRDKNWSADELSVILALQHTSDRAKCAMSNPLRHRTGKWRRWEALKLHIHGASTAHEAAAPQREQGLPQQLLIRNQGVMISSTYCVVSVFGVGVYGRLYSPGLAERHGASRYLRFEAYDPKTSHRYELVVIMSDLEWVFERRPHLLVAGKKHAIVKELIALLFFRYPSREGDDADTVANDSGDTSSSPNEPQHHDGQCEHQHLELTGAQGKQLLPPPESPVLCISPEAQLSDAARRRREREQRLRLAEEERLRALALLLQLPRRARHRLLCQSVRVSGHKLIVSLYHYPTQIRSFAIVAYHPLSSRSFSLAVGVMEAASLSRVFTLPHRWSSEQKLLVAQALIPRLRFNGARAKSQVGVSTDAPANSADDYASYRLSLAIREDRVGAPTEWLSLPPVRTSDGMRNEVLRKHQAEGQRSLRAAFDVKMQVLDAESDARAVEVDARTEVPRDAASTEGEKSSHELRRDFKAERHRIKDDLKTLNEQVGVWKRELAAMRETQANERERATKALERATRVLESEALMNTRGLYEADRMPINARRATCGQRTWLSRPHIAANKTLVASGACAIAGRRYRCSVFRAAEPPISSVTVDGELPGDDSSSSSNTSHQISQSPPGTTLSVLIYDPASSSTWTLELAQLDWISYTKQHHDAQLLVPQFEIATSPVTARLRALQAGLTACCEALAKTYTTTKKKKGREGVTAAVSKKVAKLRAQLCSEMKRQYAELRTLNNAAPWHRMVAGLGERIRFPTADTVAVDPCIFRSTLPIVSIAGEDDAPGAASKDDDDMVYCDVRVLQQRHEVTFVVVDPSTRTELSVVYPDSAELVKEFAVETFMEQQMHLEAIAMTLLFFANESTGKLDIRFED